MKKISYVMLALLIAGIATLMVVTVPSAMSQKKQLQTTNAIPDNVAKILKQSCTRCHDAGGSGLAPSIWSFSAWNEYPAKKQAKKASAMCRDMTNGSMPPSSSPKDSRPTQSQIDEVCKWATSIQPAN
jgi:cytochrome c5